MEAVKEFKAEHHKHLKSVMDELTSAGAAGSEEGFVIFETDGGKFLQLTYNMGEGLTFDLPRVSLSAEEQQKLIGLETETSYLLKVGTDTNLGAELANRIFLEVFQCRNGYPVVATLDIETA